MAKRLKLKEKLYPEENEEEEEEERKLKSAEAVSSDDDEANEDLSLKIVEKHLLMRAAKLDQDVDDFGDVVVLNENNDENRNDSSVDLPSSSFPETEVDVAGPSGVSESGVSEDTIIGNVKSDKKRSKLRKKKKQVENMEIVDQSVSSQLFYINFNILPHFFIILVFSGAFFKF